MLKSFPRRSGSLLALALGSWTATARADGDQPRFHYVSFDQADVPSGFHGFSPAPFFGTANGAINNGARVAGFVRDDSGVPHAAVYAHGSVTVLQPNVLSIGRVINERGTVGGTARDPVTNSVLAALFRGEQMELVPSQPGQSNALVYALNDPGVALVNSFNSSGLTSMIYNDGTLTPINLGTNPTPLVSFGAPMGLNNQGIISGTAGTDLLVDAVGFRFVPRTGEVTLLEPIDGDALAWAQGINQRGDVLGYSFDVGGQERIGVWDQHGSFTTYFTEGNAEFPTVSNHLFFNDNSLIVITDTSDGNSYVVPRPGERLNLADQTDDLPSWATPLFFVTGVNDQGDMVGFASFGGAHPFLLEHNGHE